MFVGNIEAVVREQHQDRLRRIAQEQLADQLAAGQSPSDGRWQQFKERWSGWTKSARLADEAA